MPHDAGALEVDDPHVIGAVRDLLRDASRRGVEQDVPRRDVSVDKRRVEAGRLDKRARGGLADRGDGIGLDAGGLRAEGSCVRQERARLQEVRPLDPLHDHDGCASTEAVAVHLGEALQVAHGKQVAVLLEKRRGERPECLVRHALGHSGGWPHEREQALYGERLLLGVVRPADAGPRGVAACGGVDEQRHEAALCLRLLAGLHRRRGVERVELDEPGILVVHHEVPFRLCAGVPKMVLGKIVGADGSDVLANSFARQEKPDVSWRAPSRGTSWTRRGRACRCSRSARQASPRPRGAPISAARS